MISRFSTRRKQPSAFKVNGDIRIEACDIDFCVRFIHCQGFPIFKHTTHTTVNSALTYVAHLIGCVSGKTTIEFIDEYRRIDHHYGWFVSFSQVYSMFIHVIDTHTKNV